jgi:hypothetical protein
MSSVEKFNLIRPYQRSEFKIEWPNIVHKSNSDGLLKTIFVE